MRRVLFVLRRHEGSGGYGTISSGLKNSATFVSNMLKAEGIADTVVVIVQDGNGIDKEVYQFKPDIVVLEAIWCPPVKLQELVKFYPAVLWVVRIHSEVQFLANEGVAVSYIAGYSKIPNTVIAPNSPYATKDLKQFDPTYLPNYYPITKIKRGQEEEKRESSLNIGCFGAIRPMKNQLAQAFAAIEYCNHKSVDHLNFYVNATRTEQGGDQVLKNLVALFNAQLKDYVLILSPWSDRDEFCALVRKMDVCMNVSLSETFCIAASDAVAQGIPVVVSPEVFWTNSRSQCDPTDIQEMVITLGNVLGLRKGFIANENIKGLRRYNNASVGIWRDFINEA